MKEAWSVATKFPPSVVGLVSAPRESTEGTPLFHLSSWQSRFPGDNPDSM